MHGSSKRTYKTPKNSEFSSNTNMAAGGEDIDPLDEEEGFYDDFQDNLNPGKQSINVHNAAGVGSSAQHSPATAIGRSPVFSLKEIGPESLSPIGLTLRKTPSFQELLENRLSHPSREDNEGGSIRNRPRRRTDNVGPQPTSEKLKASNFPIKYIRIGNWERISDHEGHLVAKLYYAKKKMVWEILVRELKNKIEMQWSDISAIRVSMHDNEDGILQIQLNKPPSFFGETNPQPRKHTIWQISSDFTQGQASIFRIHTIVFPPGVLNSHYEKLLSCDRRLLELSQQPFPSQESPYFDLPSLSGDSMLTVTGNEYRSSSASPVLQYSHQPHHKMQVRATPSGPTPSPSTTVLNFPLQNELPRKKVMIYTVGNQEIDWRNISVGIGGRQLVPSQAQDNMAMITSGNYHPVATTLNNIEEYLLGDHSQVVYHDESTIATHVPSMCSAMPPIDDPFQSQMDYRINHTASNSQRTMLDEMESYNVQRLYGFHSQAMNGLLSPPPPPPPTPNDPIVMGPEVNNVVPSLMPNNPADVVLYRFMPHGNPTNKAAIEASTSDGLTVEGIIANNWVIYDENESDWKSHAAAIAQSIHLIRKRLRWKKLIPRLEILSVQLNKPDLWDDPARAGKISREHGSIMVKMKEVNAFEQELFEHIDMIKLAREENDAELESVGTQFSLSRHESLQALLTLRRNIKEKELEALLAGEHDPCSCFIEVQAGAGGTESMDWASMVMQMYVKWAEGRGFGVTVVDEMPGELAGIKRATIKVDGEYAFGYAKAEVGSHRLVRISPFDSNKRRHTSFASVAVIPILGDGFSHFQINESDLRIERFRAGGLGVSMLTQLRVLCGSLTFLLESPPLVKTKGEEQYPIQNLSSETHPFCFKLQISSVNRSQHQNKASAMAVLQSRLDQLEMERQAQINAEHTQSLTDINFGSQIRSYVLHPYRMVKDHRTDYEVSDPDTVLQGDLDGFILSYLSAFLDKNEDEDP
ncbi:UNVERIFIED_CONTAM: Peptide chain release factor PrfB2, chloroplastic [Sesamum radiatum]|uniref:Peptide chain release factor PrfB2, chloroplastic n=1 Tax=Sesamum radiatum TaxID=300843 RepID=A0AAW2S496_SESRA